MISGKGGKFSKQANDDNDQGKLLAGIKIILIIEHFGFMKKLQTMLGSLAYDVTPCARGKMALKLLKGKKERFDLIIADVEMMDITASKFIKIVQTIQDMPIVLISEVDKPEHVHKALDFGASDLICTPTIQELKLMWKYVQYKHLSLSDKNRREEDENHNEITIPSKKHSSQNTSKNKRWRWTNELHERFIYAVNQLGLDKASPMKISELMDVPNLSKKSVSSYLQKFRETVKEKGIVDWTKITSKTASKHVQNNKISVMQPSSSSQSFLSTNQIQESESPGLNEQMLKSQSLGIPIVPEQPLPIFRLENCAPIAPNESNYVHVPCNTSLFGQRNVHISSSPQLAKNSNFNAENPSYMHLGNASTTNGVNNTGQNINHSGMVNNAQNVPALMQQNYSSVQNHTDSSFSQMARNQFNMGWKYGSSAPVAGTKNFNPVRNAYSLLNQWQNNAVQIGQHDSYIKPNATPMSNWLGNNAMQRINNIGITYNSNDVNQSLNCFDVSFTGDNVNQNYNAMGVNYGTQAIGDFGMMQSKRVGQNEYIGGVPYQGHIFNALNGNITDQNHNSMGNNYMQNLQIGINEGMGLAYPGESRLGARTENFVNGNLVSLENNSTVQGISAGNDEAGSSEVCVSEDDFVSHLLNLDGELEGMNN